MDAKLVKRFHERYIPVPYSGCWIWTSYTVSGYGQICLVRTKFAAHRLSYTIHKGEIPNGLFVLHHCDERLCVNPDHLFLGTHQDNMDDMFSKNRANTARGQNAGHSKLKDADILEIRNMYRNGLTQKKIGERFLVDQSLISRIVNNQYWNHL